eukprot:5863701-Alexandrium_andersonii.AAC.1
MNFLSRDRVWNAEGLHRRASPKFVLQAAAMLGLELAKPASTPGTKELQKMEDGDDLLPEDRALYRSVVGKIIH